MKPVTSMAKEAEGLLRIALFSEELTLPGSRKTLSQLHAKLTNDLRSNRRRGVVPIFISTLWFLLVWQYLLKQDETTRYRYIASFNGQPHAAQMAYWVEKISAKAQYIQHSYFCGFAGQARTRFRYGAAYAILADIEKAYIADRGSNWLGDHNTARASLVLGQVDHGLTWFDGRQLWRVYGSFFLVGGTGLGAFPFSLQTPTVVLSCRTVGYMVFFVVAFALLFV
ncbi:hypothetical protein PSPO01_03697 [Paraphaeosphaeria sporulosa]